MKKLTPLRAIRANCLECSGDNQAEVRLCVIPTCPLFPYRMGHNPARTRLGGPGNPANLRKPQPSDGFPMGSGQKVSEHQKEAGAAGLLYYTRENGLPGILAATPDGTKP
jgi:hypothetical protein